MTRHIHKALEGHQGATTRAASLLLKLGDRYAPAHASPGV